MGYSCLRMRWRGWHVCLWRAAIICSVAALAVQVSLAQQASERGEAGNKIYQADERVVKSFLTRAFDQGLTESTLEELNLMALNRSEIIVPELLTRLESAARDPKASKRDVHTMADILAYAGNERAIDALYDLCRLDQKRFGEFIGRTFNYANSRRNPYGLVYYALQHSDPITEAYVLRWVNSDLSLPGSYRVLAESMFERYKRIPVDSELQKDPIASRLPNGLPPQFSRELRLVAEERAKRQNR